MLTDVKVETDRKNERENKQDNDTNTKIIVFFHLENKRKESLVIALLIDVWLRQKKQIVALATTLAPEMVKVVVVW